MTDFLIYTGQVALVFAVLFGLYRLVWSRLTFHTLNRVLLLAILPLSLALPVLDIGVSAPVVFQDEALPGLWQAVGNMEAGQAPVAVESAWWSFGNVLLGLYGLGLAIGLFRFMWNTISVFRMKRKTSFEPDGNFKIVKTEGGHAFSYFKWIFLPAQGEEQADETIIFHEKLHGKAGHTIDLIIAELFVALQWFNPFVYLFRRDLKTVHEYEVDARILRADIKKSDYLQLMLDHLVKSHKTVGLYNYFNGLTIKKRVQMISKNKSSKWQLASYLLMLPIIGFMAMSFSTTAPGLGNEPSLSPIKVGAYEKVSADYGMHTHPIDKSEKFHSGIDFVAAEGTPIVAAGNGVVATAEYRKESYGKLLVVNHGNGFETWYAHMKDFNVKAGDKVKKGDVIGFVGSTGRSTGPHLHYEVRKDGKHVNPKDYISE